MAAYDYVTKENLLDLVQSLGVELKQKCHASAHPYDNEERAKSYVPMYHAARECWARINRGEDPVKMLGLFKNRLISVESNFCGLLISALEGKFEKTAEWFAAPTHGWVTYKGDFYHVNPGDRLNRPCVKRLGNGYYPFGEGKLAGAQEIADMMPNPCTRVQVSIQVL